MKVNTTKLSFYRVNFGAKTYSQRVQEKLAHSGWWDRNFGGDRDAARNSAENEMLNEIDSNWRRKNKAEHDYERYVSHYNYQSSKNSERLNELDSEIQNEQNLYTSQQTQIDTLEKRISSQYDNVAKSGKALDSIENKTNAIREKISNFEEKTSQLKTELGSIRTQTEAAIQEQTNKIKQKTNEEYSQQLSSLINKPMLYLNQNLVMPLRINQTNKDYTVPNGLLIEAPNRLYPEIILAWLVGKTNSNYAKLNANRYKTEGEFFDALCNISEQAKKNKQESNRHTLTLVTNIEKFTKDEDTQIIPFLKSFMDTTSKDYNNTIVLCTKDTTKLDSILTAKHRFPLKMSFAWKHLFTKKYSLSSMLLESFKLKTHGIKFKP